MPDNHPEVAQVNPASTDGKIYVLPWEVCVSVEKKRTTAAATHREGYAEVSRGHSSPFPCADEEPNLLKQGVVTNDSMNAGCSKGV